MAVPAAFAALVVLVAFGSSSVSVADRIGGPGRWVALFALLVVAAGALVVRRVPLRVTPVALAAGALAVLGLASAAWSVLPGLTVQRAGTFAVLLLATALVGLLAAQDAALARRLLEALGGATAVLALLGILHYLVDPDIAVQAAEVTSGSRFRGIGENPNTLPMLFAVVLPAAGWLAATASRRLVAAGWIAVAVLLLGSISASGSRGAMIGAAPALALVLVLCMRGRVLAVALAATVAAFAVAVAGTSVSKPLPASPAPVAAVPGGAAGEPLASPSGLAALVAADGRPADVVLDLGHDPNEIGRARPGQASVAIRRTLFGSSGRAQAWDGGLRQSLDRPLLGFGFGTEDRVFLDRYYVFESTRIENSFLGFWLQIGVAGLLAFVAVLAVLAARLLRGWRELRRTPGPAVAAAGIVLSGAVMAIPQSYVYSVGNVATAAFWAGAFVLGSAVLREARR